LASTVASAQEVVAAPVEVQAQVAAPMGEWVTEDGYGQVWVPAGATAYAVGADPYAYLYTPTYGWGWYGSPWGWGAYSRAAWIARPWRLPPHAVGAHWFAPHAAFGRYPTLRYGAGFHGYGYHPGVARFSAGFHGGYRVSAAHFGGFHGGGFHGRR
jgi:hypothetical protein